MLHLLLRYLYPVMLPLSLIEGPMVAVAAGAGVAAGKVNPLLAALIIAFGAFFQDTVYYWVGRLAQDKPSIRRLAERTKLLHESVLPLEEAWKRNMVATLAASKFAYGLYGPILVTAGMAKTPFRPFLITSLAMSAVILGAWFGFGFGLERVYGAMGHTGLVTGVEAGIGMGGLVALFFIGKHARKRLKIEGKKKGKSAPAEAKMKG
jgi:membrane protein DedA with SNARE-associated domain